MHQEQRRTIFGLLFVFVIAAGFGTLFLNYRLSQSLDRERVAMVSLEREIAAVDVALSDLRAAQHAYFAPDSQSPEFWKRRAADLLSRVDAGLSSLRDATSSAEARTRYEAGAAAVAALADADSRARGYIGNGQPALAADIIFTDSVESTQRVRTELGEADAAENRAASERIVRQQQIGLGATGGFFALVLVLVLVAMRWTRPAAAAPSAASLTAQMIRDLPPPVKTTGTTAPASAAAAMPSKPMTVTPPVAPAVTPPPVNLADTAELCVDLARVMDGRDVPALIERAARLLDAKGLILWAADPTGSTLQPSLTHGYSAKVISKLGSLDVSADNVTSLCYRSMRSQIIPGAQPDAAGAIAVPLITPSGCAGVLSAEVRETKPSAELVALTRIIAAQFAVLVGPAELNEARSAAQA